MTNYIFLSLLMFIIKHFKLLFLIVAPTLFYANKRFMEIVIYYLRNIEKALLSNYIRTKCSVGTLVYTFSLF